jgi:hypothetical protein
VVALSSAAKSRSPVEWCIVSMDQAFEGLIAIEQLFEMSTSSQIPLVGRAG